MSLARNFRRLAVLQVTLVLIASGVFFVQGGIGPAVSTWFGGAIAMLNVALLLWRRDRADRGRALSAGESIRLLYRSALERFIAVLALFALGMGVLELHAIALLAGFVAGQVALFFIRER